MWNPAFLSGEDHAGMMRRVDAGLQPWHVAGVLVVDLGGELEFGALAVHGFRQLQGSSFGPTAHEFLRPEEHLRRVRRVR